MSFSSHLEAMMKSGRRLLAPFLFLFSAVAFAQEQVVLTVDQAIQTGLENSKALHASRYRLNAASAKASETGTLALPSVKFSGLYTRLSNVPPEAVDMPANSFGPGFPPTDLSLTLSPTILDIYSLKATVQQPLFTGGKVSGAIDAAGYSAEASEHDLRKDEADLVYTITSAYWNLYRAVEFRKFVDENVNQMIVHDSDAVNLLKQGMMTINDVMKVQTQLSEARVRQIDAENNVTLAMYALNNTIGLPLKTVIGIGSTIRTDERNWGDVDSLLRCAFDRRPEMLGMNARVRAGEAGLASARGGWWPQFYLVGDYDYLRPNQRYFPVTDNFKGTWDVSLAVSFDIWNWWQTGYQTNEAQAQLAQAREGLSITQDGITLEVTQSYLGIRKARERKSVSELEARQAEENYRIMVGKYKQGLVANSELLDAEVALLQARLNVTQSLVDYELAIAQLTRAIGG